MEIKELMLTKSPFTRTGMKMGSPKAIIVHYTGNPGSTAMGNRNWLESLKDQSPDDNNADTYASCHYIVGLDGEILQLIPENEGAFHAGGRIYTDTAREYFFDTGRKRIYPHDKCIGIETCHPDKTGKFNEKTENSLINLTAEIARRHKLNIKNIFRHYDITSKLCPLWYVSDENNWNNFLQKVNVKLR